MCVLSHFSRVQLFTILWTVARQAPLSMQFPRPEYWRGLPFPTPGDLPYSGIEPATPLSAALAGRFFTTKPYGKPHAYLTYLIFVKCLPVYLILCHCFKSLYILTHVYMCVFSCSVMSDSLWPYGLQPASLLCPWDFPGKSTGMSCHFLFQGIFPN